MSNHRFRPRVDVAIAGFAHSTVVRHAEEPLGVITLRTVRAAVADAGLTIAEVDGFTTGALFPSASGTAVVDGVHIVTADWVAAQLGVRPRWLAGFQGIGQVSGAMILATEAIASGAADCVVVHRAMYNPPAGYHDNPMTRARGRDQWTAPHGLWGPIAHMAMVYNEYLHRYGASREAMAPVVHGLRAAGSKVEWSYWRDRPLPPGGYLEAPMVSDPMTVLDCDLPVTGVGAFVVTRGDIARSLPHRPVYVAGYAQGTATPRGVRVWRLDDIEAGGDHTARTLWANSGFGPDEIDVPQVYDGFSPFIYFWLEALGLCARGEAFRYVSDPAASGGLPHRTGGGALGNGRMHGVPQMLECYLQLSGRAGERQLARAETGVACQASPNMGGVVAYSTTPPSSRFL